MKRTILILVIFNTCLNFARANSKDDETRTATVSVEVGPTDIVDIQAKYTDINIEAWDKGEVFIEATVRFDGKMNNQVQKFLDAL